MARARTRIIVVVDQSGNVVDSQVVSLRSGLDRDAFYKQVATARKEMSARYPGGYRVHEAVAECVGDVIWAYPELVGSSGGG